jgi:hypothetical protein
MRQNEGGQARQPLCLWSWGTWILSSEAKHLGTIVVAEHPITSRSATTTAVRFTCAPRPGSTASVSMSKEPGRRSKSTTNDAMISRLPATNLHAVGDGLTRGSKSQEAFLKKATRQSVSPVQVATTNLMEVSGMKTIVCIRHLKCICRKWWRGVDYSWHVQHLLREFGLGQYAQFQPASRR